MLNFNSLSKKPRHFHNFTGFTLAEFSALVQSISDDWEELRSQKRKQTGRKRKAGGGRKLALPDLDDRLLVFLVYAKLYSSYLFLEYLFDVDESNICRIIKEFSPLLSKQIIINRSGKKITTLEELRDVIPDLDEVLVDATEQKVPRPKKKRQRKKYHSGKKKAFTMKTQIMTNSQGLVLHVSKSIPGRKHDYQHFKETPIPKWLAKHPEIKGFGDSGYQGVNKDYPQASMQIPIKRTRGKQELSRSEKIHNTKQRKKRVRVEHALSRLKKYKILADTYRNSKEQYSEIFKSIVFLANLRMLMRTA